MDEFLPEIRKMAARISETEEKRRKLAGFLRDANPETKLLSTVEADPLKDVKVVGVDGGISKKSLHGFDFMLIRAAGALFHYKEGKFRKVEYHPSRMPRPRPYIMEALSDLDWAHSAAVERQDLEIRTAIECMELFRPDILLLDGSIVPYYSERPGKGSSVYGRYVEMIGDYRTLYSRARETGTLLAGVIEDSRGTMFCDMLGKDILPGMRHQAIQSLSKILEKTRDTNMLYWTLRRGEMSRVFRYAQTPSEHPVLKELPEFASDVHSFYLKTAEFDRPVRVDVLGKDSAASAASIILAISGQHSCYGIPAPLIEADNVVKLSDNEMEVIYSQMMGYLGNSSSAMRLRREQRPF